MNPLSVFQPSNPMSYSVITYSQGIEITVPKSPDSNDYVCSSSPKLIRRLYYKPIKREKKYWSPALKQIALQKAHLLGLSKATRCLQLENPAIFGDLSPSTLQYWIQKEREQLQSQYQQKN